VPGSAPQVVANFDPDTAGNTAAAKTIALLTEEGFNIKIVTLDGGLDPDRFIRERGVDAYTAALRGARSQADFLIERARQEYPGASAEQKVKVMNYLLPHINRMPREQDRIQFARDVAKQFLLDFPSLQGEMEHSARKRLDKVGLQISRDVAAFRADNLSKSGRQVLEKQLLEAQSVPKGGFVIRGDSITEVERILIRALSATDPEHAESRRLASEGVLAHPEWFEHLNSFSSLKLLCVRQAKETMEIIEDLAQRALVAGALFDEGRPPLESEIQGALDQMHYKWLDRQFLDVENKITEANRRGDFPEEVRLAQQRLVLNRERHELANRKAS
jgi:DNA primase